MNMCTNSAINTSALKNMMAQNFAIIFCQLPCWKSIITGNFVYSHLCLYSPSIHMEENEITDFTNF